jgi:hypothetical protein
MMVVDTIIGTNAKINIVTKIGIDAKIDTNLIINIDAKISIDMKINIDEPIFDFPDTLRKISVDTTTTQIKVQDMKIAKWNILKEVQIHLLNLGTHNKPQVVKLNYNLANATEQLLKEYKDVFVWMYKDLKGIPPHLA